MKPNKGKQTSNLQERKVSLPCHRNVQSRISIEELRENFKRQMSLPKEQDILPIYDPLEKAQNSKNDTIGQTGIIFDERMADHRCLWDTEYPECPERLLNVIQRCKEYGLIERCQVLEPRAATEDEILTLHEESLYNILKDTKEEKDTEKLEKLSSKYDSVYIHPKSYDCALLSAGCTLDLVKAVVERKIQNGMALIRPPGHHATKDSFCGYCFFNNVALAAKLAVDQLGVRKVLIVDWDVHHGQATQRMFYDDPRVLYFSFHRYENGTYWPHLRESDFDYIGSEASGSETRSGIGFNVNIPLNDIGLKNEDYLAVFHQILLPIAYEFNPELILVSAGYDSAIGDWKGEMNLTPSCYSHFISLLSGLANGKLAVVLEGGYCLESLAEGAAHTLRALLGDPCPPFVDPLLQPNPSIQKTMQDVVSVLRPYWKALSVLSPQCPTCVPQHLSPFEDKPMDAVFLTRGGHHMGAPLDVDLLNGELQRLKEGSQLTKTPHRVCLVYDSQMELHCNEADRDFPERPQRTRRIMEHMESFGLLKRVFRLKPREAVPGELELVHRRKLIDQILQIPKLSEKECSKFENKFNSIYFNGSSAKAALLASGCLLQVVDSVCEGQSRCGVGVLRPPGHHAEPNEPNGFCIFNNVAIAAAYATKKHSLKRVLILDWDIHHGNGIQHAFESNREVLYISLHLYKHGDFFPYSTDADADRVGEGGGVGFNVNIPWSKGGVGDADYMAAFAQVVLPIAYQFAPQLVLVSAGFDAAVHDPLGGCRVTPEGFGHMTSLLSSLAGGRIILALEGGYSLNATSLSLIMCTKALLGDPLPSLKHGIVPSSAALNVIEKVRKIQMKYWSCLCPQIATTPDRTKTPEDDSEFVTPPESPECLEALQKHTGTASDDIDDLEKQVKDMSIEAHPAEGPGPATGEAPSIEGAVGGAEGGGASAFAISLMNEEQMFAVVPLEWCPHLNEVAPVPNNGINAKAKCQNCANDKENWICLTCYQVCCGRYVREHMVQHGASTGHPIVLSFSDLSIWCYACSSYLQNSVLEEALSAAATSKFGIPS